ncbi:MAG: hypothetical protein ACK5Z0_03900 [Planctomycetota bacterium]
MNTHYRFADHLDDWKKRDGNQAKERRVFNRRACLVAYEQPTQKRG